MDVKAWAGLLAIEALPAYIKNAENEMLAEAQASGALRPALRLVINRRAKRLRPTLLIAAAALSRRPIGRAIISAAAAVEMVHQASLVHDDIIDNSKTRNDQPSLSAIYGASAAIIAGDYLLAGGCRRAVQASQEAGRILSEAAATMSQGQAKELTGSIAPLSDAYIIMARQKSAALFLAACQIGASLGGLPASSVQALGGFGEAFGIAFQIIDDLGDNDFSPEYVTAARNLAKKYCSLAQNSLKKLPDGRITRRLSAIPAAYLELALR